VFNKEDGFGIMGKNKGEKRQEYIFQRNV